MGTELHKVQAEMDNWELVTEVLAWIDTQTLSTCSSHVEMRIVMVVTICACMWTVGDVLIIIQSLHIFTRHYLKSFAIWTVLDQSWRFGLWGC